MSNHYLSAIRTGAQNQKYADGYDRIFGEGKKPVKPRRQHKKPTIAQLADNFLGKYKPTHIMVAGK